jgi:multiple sugar transport system permease protein
MIITSLKSDAEVAHLATNPWIISNGVTFEQYRLLFQGTDFLIYFKNTIIVTLCVVAITIVYALILPVLLLVPKRLIETSDGEVPEGGFAAD